MNNIIFYKNKDGISEVEQYLQLLQSNTDKNSRIKFNKIIAYINMLEKYGINLREPYIKYLDNGIWELRPLRDRILFAHYDNNNFILLSVFVKQTQKTPRKEIKKAEKYLNNFKKRSDYYG